MILYRSARESGTNAPVAQLDRVTDYESVGQGFESLPAYQIGYLRVSDLFYFRDSKIQNLTRRGRVSGDGSTEPHLCFRPFPGENANESLPAYQNEHLRVFVLFLFSSIFCRHPFICI